MIITDDQIKISPSYRAIFGPQNKYLNYFDCSFCRTNCEFYIAIMVRHKNCKNKLENLFNNEEIKLFCSQDGTC